MCASPISKLHSTAVATGYASCLSAVGMKLGEVIDARYPRPLYGFIIKGEDKFPEVVDINFRILLGAFGTLAGLLASSDDYIVGVTTFMAVSYASGLGYCCKRTEAERKLMAIACIVLCQLMNPV